MTERIGGDCANGVRDAGQVQMNYSSTKRKQLEELLQDLGIDTDASKKQIADTVREIIAELESGKELTKPCGFCDRPIPVTSPMGYCYECEMEMGW